MFRARTDRIRRAVALLDSRDAPTVHCGSRALADAGGLGCRGVRAPTGIELRAADAGLLKKDDILPDGRIVPPKEWARQGSAARADATCASRGSRRDGGAARCGGWFRNPAEDGGAAARNGLLWAHCRRRSLNGARAIPTSGVGKMLCQRRPVLPCVLLDSRMRENAKQRQEAVRSFVGGERV